MAFGGAVGMTGLTVAGNSSYSASELVIISFHHDEFGST
jgi:hypothetical protein